MRFCKALLTASCLLVGTAVQAHKSSDAYVRLSGGGSAEVVVRLDVALRDLDVALDLDTDGDGKLTWAEVRSAWPAIETYVVAHFQLEGCTLPAAARSLQSRIDGVYAALQWRPDCRPAAAPSIRYSLLAQLDPTHRGIARIDWAGTAPVLRVLVPRIEPAFESLPATDARLATGPSPTDARPDGPAVTATRALQFLREGVQHIVTGYDHVLFLICLLLPSVMRRTAQGWQPVDRLAQAVWPVAGIVTAFTVAHSITLALAASGTVSLSPAVIEPGIALTIILAAIDNVRPIFGGRRVWVTFAFGLVHGFGFANVLSELNLPRSQFVWALLQFNIGLELGQLFIVVVVTTLLFALRRKVHYARWFIRGGSLVAMAIGAIWLVERTAKLSLLPL